MGVERGRRADVPPFDLEAEPGQEIADVVDAAACLGREVGGLLGLALGAEADQIAKEAMQFPPATLRSP